MADGSITQDSTTVGLPYGATADEVAAKAPDVEDFELNGSFHRFKGWSPAVHEVTGTETYEAQWEVVEMYDITWVWYELGEDDAVVEKQKVVKLPAGESLLNYFPGVYDFETVDTVYEFKGWSPEFRPVDGNETYVALFESSPRLYAITWIWKKLGEDGSVVEEIKDEYLKYGESLLDYFPGVFDFATVDTVYEFKGWSPEFRPVDGNEVYVAQFDTSTRKYDITWVWQELGEDNTVVEKRQVTPIEFGESLLNYFPGVFDFATVDTVYEFKGWSPEFRPVDGEETYVAQFETSPRKYDITWVWKEPGENNTVVEKQQVSNLEYGESLTNYFPGVFDFETEDGYYRFIGWSPEFRPVDGEETYEAQYEFGSRDEEYTITWIAYEEDGEGGLKEVQFTGKYPGAATLEGEFPAVHENLYTQTEVYAFTGWLPEPHPVSGDEPYIAQYDVSPRMYLVTWITLEFNLEDDLIEAITSKAYPYGASLEGEFPAVYETINTDASVYTFTGWSPEPKDTVTEDITYTALYNVVQREYLISWYNDAGELIDTTLVPYEAIPTHEDPTKPATSQYTYKFVGWTPDIVPVTGDAAYTAVFTAEPIQVTYTPPLTVPQRSSRMNRKFAVYYGETPDPKQPEPALVVEWGQASGVATYEVYVGYLEDGIPTTPRVTVNYGAYAAYITDFDDHVVDPSRSYIAFVVAKNRKGEEVGRTVIAYVAGPDAEYTNPASLTVSPAKNVTLKVGESVTISASVTLEDGSKPEIPDVPEFRYSTTFENIATVSESGVITAVRKGTCIVQVYTKNGLVEEIVVNVK